MDNKICLYFDRELVLNYEQYWNQITADTHLTVSAVIVILLKSLQNFSVEIGCSAHSVWLVGINMHSVGEIFAYSYNHVA